MDELAQWFRSGTEARPQKMSGGSYLVLDEIGGGGGGRLHRRRMNLRMVRHVSTRLRCHLTGCQSPLYSSRCNSKDPSLCKEQSKRDTKVPLKSFLSWIGDAQLAKRSFQCSRMWRLREAPCSRRHL